MGLQCETMDFRRFTMPGANYGNIVSLVLQDRSLWVCWIILQKIDLIGIFFGVDVPRETRKDVESSESDDDGVKTNSSGCNYI